MFLKHSGGNCRWVPLTFVVQFVSVRSYKYVNDFLNSYANKTHLQRKGFALSLVLMLPTHENIKQENNNRSVGEKGEGDELLELPSEILQDDTGQVVGNERTHQIRTSSRNNNTTTRLKRGPNPLSGVLIPRP